MSGILSALRGYLRDAAPGGVLNPEVTPQGILDSAAISSMVVPGVGDVAGLVADLNRYRTDPASRTPGNFALTGIGMLPLIPSLTVWHGSPHRFKPTPKNPLGEFDPSRIGSGEGAQAFGYGHYVAEKPGVAATYKEISTPLDFEKAVDAIWPVLRKGSIFSDDAIAFGPLQTKMDKAAFIERYKQNPDAVWQELTPRLQAEVNKALAGHLYKSDLADDAIPKMLDLDKPLSQQTEVMGILQQSEGWPAIQSWLGKHMSNMPAGSQPDGELLREALEGALGKEGASRYLAKLGIQGNVYLDAGSRGAGQGTRNFVVYPGNEGILNILDVE